MPSIPVRTPPGRARGRRQTVSGVMHCLSFSASDSSHRPARLMRAAHQVVGHPPRARRTPRTSPRSNGHHEAAAASGAGSGGRRFRTRPVRRPTRAPRGATVVRAAGVSCPSRGGDRPHHRDQERVGDLNRPFPRRWRLFPAPCGQVPILRPRNSGALAGVNLAQGLLVFPECMGLSPRLRCEFLRLFLFVLAAPSLPPVPELLQESHGLRIGLLSGKRQGTGVWGAHHGGETLKVTAALAKVLREQGVVE